MAHKNRWLGAYAEHGPREGLESYPAVYSPSGKSAHLLGILGSPNHDSMTLCGRLPGWTGCWFGTGSEDEYDIARSLPLCQVCHDVARAQIAFVADVKARQEGRAKWLTPAT